MKYDELKTSMSKHTLKLIGAIPIWDINKFINNANFDSIYTSDKLFKELAYQTNRHIVDNKFDRIMYHLSTTNLDFDKTIILLKKLLGGFDIKNNKFYCINGREFNVNILEEVLYKGEIFLVKDGSVVGYIDTCDIYTYNT